MSSLPDVTTHPRVSCLQDTDIDWGLAPLVDDPTPKPVGELLVDALIDGQAYRLALAESLRHAHSLHLEVVALQARYDRLLTEHRALRAGAGA